MQEARRTRASSSEHARMLCMGTATTFSYSLAYVLSDLETGTPNRPGLDSYTRSPYQEAVAYGHASCNSQISYPDCASCISYPLKGNCSKLVLARLGHKCSKIVE
ncbi:hypothetical protein CDL15_Pgr016658 [Punica granatum]|uniref:Uncharacterized protein n=1 Tax=Punica granatum TaxID=22663 RepID=A0A218XSC7_PUNGR|nr:hypothetical protein CDL15_Pgr016658 [Punica granatum]